MLKNSVLEDILGFFPKTGIFLKKSVRSDFDSWDPLTSYKISGKY